MLQQSVTVSPKSLIGCLINAKETTLPNNFPIAIDEVKVNAFSKDISAY